MPVKIVKAFQMLAAKERDHSNPEVKDTSSSNQYMDCDDNVNNNFEGANTVPTDYLQNSCSTDGFEEIIKIRLQTCYSRKRYFKKKKDHLIILGTEEFPGFISIWKLVQYFVTFIWLHTVKDTKYFQGMQTQHLWQEAFITRKNQVNRISPNFLRNIQYLRKQGLGLSGNLEEEVFEKTETCIRIGWKRNETDIHRNYQNEIIRITAFILTLISLKTSAKFVLTT